MTALATRIGTTVDTHPRLIAGILGGLIFLFLASCLLHDVIPICHWIFRCDHRMH